MNARNDVTVDECVDWWVLELVLNRYALNVSDAATAVLKPCFLLATNDLPSSNVTSSQSSATLSGNLGMHQQMDQATAKQYYSSEKALSVCRHQMMLQSMNLRNSVKMLQVQNQLGL